MKTAEWGSLVKIKFTMRLDNGSVVDTPEDKRRLNFNLGAGKIMPALEEGIVGMAENEIKQIKIAPQDGYGEYNKELVIRVERTNFPSDLKLVVGGTVQYQNRDGERVNFVINALDEKTVTIDGNHPLAGINITYEVELLEVQ